MNRYTATDSLDSLSDEYIMSHVQGEPWLMSTFIERYEDAFLDEANTLTHHSPHAEEVVQDTFKKMYANPRGYETSKDHTCIAWAEALLQESIERYLTESQQAAHKD